MSDQAASSIERRTATTTVDATIDQCYAVGIDVEAYPNWIESLAHVVVESRDGSGNPHHVRFEASGLGRRSSYVLAYDLADAPESIGWSLVSGDLTRVIEGEYRFSELSDEAVVGSGDATGSTTRVDYRLTIDLAVPLPGFVKRRAEDKIMEAALRRFKNEVERQASGPASGSLQPE